MRHCLVMADKVTKLPFIVNNIITNQGVTPFDLTFDSELELRMTGKTIAMIIEEECKQRHISPNELKAGRRRRKVSTLRTTIAKRGLDELGLSMAEIARHVGVTTSSIAKAVARLEEEG